MTIEEFKLPDVGEGVAEGELVSWLVEPGDAVTEDQPVAEVETDKALVEVPSPFDGTVKELLAEEGEMVPVGNVFITFQVDDGDADATDETVDSAIEAAETPVETTDEDETADEVETRAGRVFAPPSVRRLARELGVDLGSIEGSGPGGRISEGDVRAAAERADRETPERSTASEPASVTGDGETTIDAGGSSRSVEADPSGVTPADRDRTLAVPATRKRAEELGVDIDEVPTDRSRDGEPFVTTAEVEAYAAALEAGPEAEPAETTGVPATTGAAVPASTVTGVGGERREVIDRIPYRGVRRTIGEQMERSKYTAPHVTHHDTVVVDELVDLRAELKETAAERGVKLTYMPFVMKALVRGFEAYPILNAELDEENEEIVVKGRYNVGVAVATDAGLMVPVVEDVDRKSILELAAEINDLAARARDRELAPEEMQGGTFTITNFGAIGGEYATPIINYPETAILGLGAIEERAVAQDGEVVAKPTLPLSLSIDHRVIDGAEAGAFTNEVMEYLRDPNKLLLESR